MIYILGGETIPSNRGKWKIYNGLSRGSIKSVSLLVASTPFVPKQQKILRQHESTIMIIDDKTVITIFIRACWDSFSTAETMSLGHWNFASFSAVEHQERQKGQEWRRIFQCH